MLQPACTCSDSSESFHLEAFAMPAVTPAGKGRNWSLNLNYACFQLQLIHWGRTCWETAHICFFRTLYVDRNLCETVGCTARSSNHQIYPHAFKYFISQGFWYNCNLKIKGFSRIFVWKLLNITSPTCSPQPPKNPNRNSRNNNKL